MNPADDGFLHERLSALTAERDALRAKLDAAERGAAEMRRVLRSLPGASFGLLRASIENAISSDAGRDYVPRGEVDAAWRKGMSDAANIAKMLEPDDAHNAPHNVLTSDAIIASRDAKPAAAPPDS